MPFVGGLLAWGFCTPTFSVVRGGAITDAWGFSTTAFYVALGGAITDAIAACLGCFFASVIATCLAKMEYSFSFSSVSSSSGTSVGTSSDIDAASPPAPYAVVQSFHDVGSFIIPRGTRSFPFFDASRVIFLGVCFGLLVSGCSTSTSRRRPDRGTRRLAASSIMLGADVVGVGVGVGIARASLPGFYSLR